VEVARAFGNVNAFPLGLSNATDEQQEYSAIWDMPMLKAVLLSFTTLHPLASGTPDKGPPPRTHHGAEAAELPTTQGEHGDAPAGEAHHRQGLQAAWGRDHRQARDTVPNEGAWEEVGQTWGACARMTHTFASAGSVRFDFTPGRQNHLCARTRQLAQHTSCS
jgi:hypothetical protein